MAMVEEFDGIEIEYEYIEDRVNIESEDILMQRKQLANTLMSTELHARFEGTITGQNFSVKMKDIIHLPDLTPIISAVEQVGNDVKDIEENSVYITARVCHEVNRAYCMSIGDHSQVPWDDCADWQRKSAIDGVVFLIDNPDKTPEEVHNNWMADKIKDGWSYGEQKNALLKTHPCIRPYWELPVQQRTKDLLFKAVVNSMW